MLIYEQALRGGAELFSTTTRDKRRLAQLRVNCWT
jgi:hypothetical protein